MKLSIVTPSYNQGEFIGQTFESVLNQDLQGVALEYFVFDACSTDSTADVIETYRPRFAERGIRFEVVREKDKGQSDAINKGWKRVSGLVVSYLNSDDYYEPGALQTVARYFSEHPASGWAYGGWRLVGRDGTLYRSVQPERFSKARLLNYCNIGQPSCFFRKELLDVVGPLDLNLHLAMDYDLWLRFAERGEAGIIPQVLSTMRYYADAKSASRTAEQVREVYRLGAAHTHPFSWRRFAQRFYLIRGLVSVSLKQDVSHRVERSKPLP